MSRLFSVALINKVVATNVIHCNAATNVKRHKNLLLNKFLLNFLKFAHAQNLGSSVTGAVEPTSPAPLPIRIGCTDDRIGGANSFTIRGELRPLAAARESVSNGGPTSGGAHKATAEVPTNRYY